MDVVLYYAHQEAPEVSRTMEKLVKKTHDDRLLGHTVNCSICGMPSGSTGDMVYSTRFNLWYLTYHCKECGEPFEAYTPETNELAKTIAAERKL
jgi:hypothetical protein